MENITKDKEGYKPKSEVPYNITKALMSFEDNYDLKFKPFVTAIKNMEIYNESEESPEKLMEYFNNVDRLARERFGNLEDFGKLILPAKLAFDGEFEKIRVQQENITNANQKGALDGAQLNQNEKSYQISQGRKEKLEKELSALFEVEQIYNDFMKVYKTYKERYNYLNLKK